MIHILLAFCLKIALTVHNLLCLICILVAITTLLLYYYPLLLIRTSDLHRKSVGSEFRK